MPAARKTAHLTVESYKKVPHLTKISFFPANFNEFNISAKCGFGSKYISGFDATNLWKSPDKCVCAITFNISSTQLRGKKGIPRSCLMKKLVSREREKEREKRNLDMNERTRVHRTNSCDASQAAEGSVVTRWCIFLFSHHLERRSRCKSRTHTEAASRFLLPAAPHQFFCMTHFEELYCISNQTTFCHGEYVIQWL